MVHPATHSKSPSHNATSSQIRMRLFIIESLNLLRNHVNFLQYHTFYYYYYNTMLQHVSESAHMYIRYCDRKVFNRIQCHSKMNNNLRLLISLKLWTVTICSVNTKYIPFTLTPKKRKNYASSSKSSLQSSYVDVITLPLDLIVCLVFDINWYKLMIIYRTNFNRIRIVVCKSTSSRFETDERNKFTNE